MAAPQISCRALRTQEPVRSVAVMDDSHEVRARWAAGLREAAARAYATGHGAEAPAPHATRWRVEPRTAVSAAVVLVLLAAWVWWGLVGDTAAAPVAPLAVASSASPSAAGASGAPPATPVVVVHVSGAVERPGLVELESGARVAAAIDAAGGLTATADPSSINLARVVVDGEHIRVGDRGEPAAAGAAGAGPAAGVPLDLNAADSAALEELPGIGPVLAGRIVADREANGPFASVEDLGRVPGVGPAILESIADLATT
jgi:competence protein ComEA